ncbi:MAG: hypothetical protein U0840_06945 [Gemmataceae bacterium]|jgi:hypothetical protein
MSILVENSRPQLLPANPVVETRLPRRRWSERLAVAFWMLGAMTMVTLLLKDLVLALLPG